MTSPLKVLPTRADESDPYERIYGRLQPKFLSDTYMPSPDDAALWGRTCSVRACIGWDSHGTPPLCSRHRHRLHYARVAMTKSAGEVEAVTSLANDLLTIRRSTVDQSRSTITQASTSAGCPDG
jgi:hypothetical protein